MATQIFVKDIIERIKTFDKSEAANCLKAKCTQPMLLIKLIKNTK